METLYSFDVKTITGQPQKMEAFKGKVLLIVNTASECGFTYQYKGLEALHQKYKARGLEVLGFPCNQFGGQEPGQDHEIATFCERNFGVTFPMFSKVDVNGDDAHPLFRFRRPPLLVPWPEVRYVGERRMLWRRAWVLDLGGITTVAVKKEAYVAIEPCISRRIGVPAA